MRRSKDLEYYARELDSLYAPDKYGAQIIIKANGKSTKHLNLNSESMEALKAFFDLYLSGDRCTCGAVLPTVEDDETPFQFCSEECKGGNNE